MERERGLRGVSRWAGVGVVSIAFLAGCGADAPAAGADLVDDASESDATAPEADGAVGTGAEVLPVPIMAAAEFFDLFRHDRVPRVTVRMTQEAWDGLVADMLDYAAIDGYMRTGRYHHADFVFAPGDGTEERVEDIGFRTRGNTTRVVPEDEEGAYHKAHFKLRFNETFDLEDGSDAAKSRKARRFRTLRGLNLKWNNDDDLSQIRELYAYDLLRRGGVSVPLTGPVALTIEIGGTPVEFGLYLAIEEIDEAFLAKRRGALGHDGDLYKCLWQQFGPATLEPIRDARAVGVKDWARNYRPAYDLQTNETTSNHAALKAFIAKLRDLDGEALATWLDVNFDVERLLRWIALNLLIGMPDDYWAMGNNYYLYFDAAGGLTEFLPYDYDHGFGGGWEPTPEWSYAGIAEADIYRWKNLNAAWGDPSTRHPLVDKVLAVPRYRARYEALLAAYTDPDRGLFDYADYARTYAAQATLYAPFLANATGEGSEMRDDGQAAWYFATKIAAVRAQLGVEADPER